MASFFNDKCSPLRVANEKICQETGKKIRESKSVQKSAKLVHLTFKVKAQRPTVRTCRVNCWRIFISETSASVTAEV
jgi:hypothetical protein